MSIVWIKTELSERLKTRIQKLEIVCHKEDSLKDQLYKTIGDRIRLEKEILDLQTAIQALNGQQTLGLTVETRSAKLPLEVAVNEV